MAIIKCKMCGGDMELSADKTYGMCEFCGSTMTLPKIDDDQRAAAFNRGNHFRRIGEFDKALAVYERIVRENEADAEAHWCCALCRFGIEYVEDPTTYEWIPTCHRASFDSFLEDVDYLAAVEYSDGITQRQYRKDAARIAEVQRGILATSQNEEPYDVFICYKETDEQGERTRDSLMAQDIYYQLTEQGRRVFFARITLEDIVGKQYEPYIFAALNSAKVMIVVGTKPEHLNAVWVKNEWSRFLAMMRHDRSKLLLPCYRDMDPYDLPEQLSVLQSYDMSKIGFIQDLTRGISKVLDAEKKPEPVREAPAVQPVGGSNLHALVERGRMALEDGEWSKADGFFEEALNQDARCAAAYYGKFLAAHRQQSLKNVVMSRVKGSPVRETIKVCKTDNTWQAKILSYALEGYLSEDELRKLTFFAKSYSSAVKWRGEKLAEVNSLLNQDKSLARAFQFADGELKQQLENEKRSVLESLNAALMEEQAKKQQQIRQIDAEYEVFRGETEQKAAELRKDAEQRREQEKKDAYDKAFSKYERAGTVYECNAASREFEALGDYADAAAMVARCEQKVKELVEADFKARYEEAENLMNHAEAAYKMRKAEQAFARIRGYRDAEEKMELCRKKAEEMERMSSLQARKAERKKRTIRTVVILLILAAAAAAIVLTQFVLPERYYGEAMQKLEAGEYGAAAEMFEKVGDRKDAPAQRQNAEMLHAKELLESGAYEEALEIYQSYPNVEEAILGWKKTCYAMGEALTAEGEYVLAAEKFESAMDYEDGAERLKEVCYILGEQNLADGDELAAAGYFGKAWGYRDAEARTKALWAGKVKHRTLCADDASVFAVRENGMIAVAMKDVTYNGYLDLKDEIKQWRDIVAIAHGSGFLVGLRSDGTVVVSGSESAAKAVAEWSAIMDIAVDYGTIYGLRADGTVLSSHGTVYAADVVRLISNGEGFGVQYADGTIGFYGNKIEKYGWENVVELHDSTYICSALLKDGTVVWAETAANQSNGPGSYRDAEQWTDIVALSGDSLHLLGLKKDGTVVSVGSNEWKARNVAEWRNIVQLEATLFMSVGLKSDGSVVCTDYSNGLESIQRWYDIRVPD